MRRKKVVAPTLDSNRETAELDSNESDITEGEELSNNLVALKECAVLI